MKKIFVYSLTLLFCYSTVFSQKFDNKMQEYGLVDIQTIDESIEVSLAYATKDNFMKTDMYGDLKKAYLQPEIAERVARAAARLEELKPGYRMLILDAARPVSVQKYMYSLVKGTPQANYVANPAVGGRHNYGIAVDITIIAPNGRQLDMGTHFDFFGIASHTSKETELVATGAISQQAAYNRNLLYTLMSEQGLKVNKYEWWHFDRYTIDDMKKKFKLLDF